MEREDEHCSPCKTQKAPEAGIDVLPDEALQHVLSFLPSQEAVQTCVLARRWRYLWRSVPALRLSERGLSRGLTEQEFSTLNSFVTNFLLHRERDATLDLCELHINELESEVADRLSPQIGILIQQALLCKAQTLRFELFKYFDDTYLVIEQHLTSQHLMMLELSCVWVTSEFLDFSSCPALKKLLMNMCTIDAAMLSSQSLEQLTIMNCFSGSGMDIRTRIVAPNLVQLELTDNFMKTPLLQSSMPSLTKGFIRLHGSCDVCCQMYGHSCSGNRCDKLHKYDDKSDGSTYSVLLKGLSEAESLELVAEPRTFIFERDLLWCPIFGNLKTLLLNEWCVENGFQAILCFLQHTPVLEKLILQLCKAPMNWVGRKKRYNPSKHPLASKKLKCVEIKCERFDERVQKIFRILSCHCVFIERINVQKTERGSECYSFHSNEDLPLRLLY